MKALLQNAASTMLDQDGVGNVCALVSDESLRSGMQRSFVVCFLQRLSRKQCVAYLSCAEKAIVDVFLFVHPLSNLPHVPRRCYDSILLSLIVSRLSGPWV